MSVAAAAASPVERVRRERIEAAKRGVPLVQYRLQNQVWDWLKNADVAPGELGGVESCEFDDQTLALKLTTYHGDVYVVDLRLRKQ